VQLATLQDGQQTRIGGIVSKLQPKLTKQGKAMAVMTIEDLDGPVEVLVFPEAYAKCAAHLKADAAVFVTGSVNLREDKPKIYADRIMPLTDVPKNFTKAMHIRLSAATTSEAVLDRVREVLRAGKGNVPVMFCFIYPDGKLVFLEAGEHFSVTPTEKLVQDLEAIIGEETVWLKVDTEKMATSTRPSRGGDWQKRNNGNANGITWDTGRPEKS
jgi:DNA polymerase-3 subunit alpha